MAVALAVALRVWPRLRWREFPSSDGDFHRAYIALIRQHGFRVPRHDPRFLVPGRGVYPAGYHLALACLPAGLVDWADRFGGLICDGVIAVLVSLVLRRLGHVGSTEAVALVSLYLIAPGLSLVQLTPRAYSLTVRPVAEALYGVIIVVALASFPPADARAARWLFVLLVLPTTLTFVSSKFGLQNAVFVAPVLAVVSRSVLPLLVAFAAAALAVVVSKGFFLRQLQGQFYHLKWFARFRLGDLRHRTDWRRLWRAARGGDARAVALQVLFDNPILTGVVRQFLFFVALGMAYLTTALAPDQMVAAAFCLAAVPAWLLTSIGPFRILGEAERYLEFAFPAGWFLFWSSIGPGTWVPAAAGLGALFAATYGLNLRVVRSWIDWNRLPARREVAEFLSRFPGCTLFCLNVTEHYHFFGSTSARLCCALQQICPLDQGWAHFSEYYGRYPYINVGNFRRLLDRFSADFVLISRRQLDTLQSERGPMYDFAGLDVVFENEGYIVRRRRG